ncbi:tRNA uridine-5-carboxymethylaminomethyl(34) synthesis GTPase MnmE [Ancylobacter defluvii]|uniref:tRNA modification GTPase MnmE n=1 Tax=Ancylobacter defluvii TaxID=1282440 RepID=A0A9W6NAE1_9HYPH|nr:tRNA uridine-5-carboxymethylaminomethyl(34) synthesis GTPase MnmE [Ancylobacter defluvii]MBS7587186.1 tRNA uridine-5-carboxymethylaminomethyl(34) synthesis GTPase MnmE [Ancylobacter defluvii]GLK83500.1 tRNA modification GTPase MnmE [Ancylobacter defluvii]
MNGQEESTIAAVSSGSGAAAVAVIRVSGPRAGEAVRALAGRLPPPRRASLARLVDPRSGEGLDSALVLWFPGPASATGEDMAEFQVHGGRAVVAAVLAALFALPGVRPAERGEFSRRAFLNGRMSLAEAEGLADLIAAETAQQRRQALAHAFGHLADRVEGWRAALVRGMALIEAGIDFAEEDDVPAEARALARPGLEALLAELDTALADRRGAMVRDGATIAIAGRPNAGKSSLMNALAARDVAIVSDEPGTTRDVLEVALDLDGHKAILIDTAGLREAAGAVEAEGIRRARARIEAADLVLWVHDGSDSEALAIEVTPPPEAGLWLVVNKSDLAGGPMTMPAAARTFAVSARTGDGLDGLTAALAGFVTARAGGAEHPALIRERQRGAVAEAAGHLRQGLAGWEMLSDELIAEELRLAARALGRVTGAIDVEDLLDVVFREFCIGK